MAMMLFGYIVLIGLIGKFSNVQSIPNSKNPELPDFLLGTGPVILERSKVTEEIESCEKSEVDECMEKLQTFLRLTSLPFASDEQELSDLCEKAAGGYNCTISLSRSKNCLSAKDKELVPVFVEMAEYMYFKICGNGAGAPGYMKEAFLKNSECIKKNEDKMKCCSRDSKIPDLPILRILEDNSKSMGEKHVAACCPVVSYIRCASTNIKESCDENAGNFTYEYIRGAMGEQLQAVCQNMPNFPEPDPKVCPTPPPVCSGCLPSYLCNIFLVIFCSIICNRKFKIF